jgi:hypothetical protein
MDRQAPGSHERGISGRDDGYSLQGGRLVARVRTIKPEFWSDEKLTECSLKARLLFIGTWNFADDAGNLDRSAKQIKARVFPVDSLDCEPLLAELIAQGLLIEYSVSGKKFLHIRGFEKHQVINRPSKPQCPEYDDSLSTQGTITEDSLSTHNRREVKGREGKRREEGRNAAVLISEDWEPSTRAVEKISREFGLVPEDVQRYVAAFTDICKAKAYRYSNFDSAFANSVRQDWPKLRNGRAAPNPDARAVDL